MNLADVKGSIRTKLLGGVLAIEIAITLVFAFILVFSFRQNLATEALRSVDRSHGVWDIIMKNDTKMLSAALDSFATNDTAKQVFVEHQDREKLFTGVRDLYQSNKERHGITHLYFIDPDGTCFLRVHKKEQFGDVIGRTTFVSAKSSNATASGLELGKNVFALRVVTPYMSQGKQVGFLEFAEEIGHFDTIVKKETGVDVAVLVDKRYLKEADYREARKAAGQPDDWDDLKEIALVSTTVADRKFVGTVAGVPAVWGTKAPAYFGTTHYAGRTLAKGSFPLTDASGKQVGAVLVLSDVTEQTSNERMALLLLIVAALLVFGVTFVGAVRYLQAQIIGPIVDLSNQAIEISTGNVEKKLETERTDEIGLLIRSFERMRVSLRKSLARRAKQSLGQHRQHGSDSRLGGEPCAGSPRRVRPLPSAPGRTEDRGFPFPGSR